jgi:hypothetical protein
MKAHHSGWLRFLPPRGRFADSTHFDTANRDVYDRFVRFSSEQPGRWARRLPQRFYASRGGKHLLYSTGENCLNDAVSNFGFVESAFAENLVLERRFMVPHDFAYRRGRGFVAFARRNHDPWNDVARRMLGPE